MIKIYERSHAQIFEFFIGCIAYSFKAWLILFLTQTLSLKLTTVYSIMACFLGISSILQSLVINFVDRIFTYLFAICQGLLLSSIGIFLMLFLTAEAMRWLYVDLSLILMGEVLFSSGVLIFSAKLCKADSVGMIFKNNYLFLNLGSIVGPFISGLIYTALGVNAALDSILLFIILAMINFFIFFLQKSHAIPIKKINWLKNILIPSILIFALAFAISLIFLINISLNLFELILWVLISVWIFWQLKKPEFPKDNSHINIWSINFIGIFFFIIFGQINGSMVLFINSHVLNQIGNFRIPPQWFLSLEPAFVILWVSLLKNTPRTLKLIENLSILQKLTVAMLLLAVAFALLAIVNINAFWLILFYLFISLSDVIFFPNCLVYLSKMTSSKLSGLVFSYFLTSRGIGIYLSMYLSKIIFDTNFIPNYNSYKFIFLFSSLAIIAALVSLGSMIVDKILNITKNSAIRVKS